MLQVYTCQNTCKVPARHAFITSLCFPYAEACCALVPSIIACFWI